MSSASTVPYGDSSDSSDSDTLVYTSDSGSSASCVITQKQVAAIFKAIREGKRKGYKESSRQMTAMIRRAIQEA
jgi:hypothetical protein